MPTPDYDFWWELARAQVLAEQIGRAVKFTDQEGVPLDLNHPKGKSEIAAFKHFATSLEDKVLELLEIAETFTTYPEVMEKILSEKENESLPVEGNPRHEVGA